MKKNYLKALCLGALLAGSAGLSAQQAYELTLDTKKVGAEIKPTMYGLFFEDINFAADGGLYAEMVKNRSFDFPQNLMGWYTFGKVAISKENAPFANNPNYVILSNSGHGHKYTGIENEGFRGMGFKANADYRFSVWAKKVNAAGNQKIRINLLDDKNNIIANKDLEITSNDWKKYEIKIAPNKTVDKGRLRIFLASEGSVALEHVSLFPTDTYKGRENGLRADLAQALADLNPGVFRFPGGCIVEGTDLETRYDWKKSVGQVENRPLNENRWHYTFTHRFFPDYFQSYGLGFYEFFLLSEDIGAEPLPVLNCGLACQYQNDDEHAHVPVDGLECYIQDALDLIEFANGPVTSTWGKLRAEMGHPEPFNLKYVGIGNEQWGSEYVDRLPPFIKAIREKYPEIKIIGSSGPSADGKQFDYLWPEMKRLKVDLVDEHYYKEPKWFLDNAARYDGYDRKGPAVFAGEYAAHDHPTGKQNNFNSALAEAAFMTGLERNADIVHMCTYAPLFAHYDGWQWNPDLIWFDNLRVVKTPNYYVQQIYAKNTGTNVLKLLQGKTPLTGQDGLYASAVWDKNESCYIVKVVNTATSAKEVQITLTGLKKNTALSLGECIMMQDNDLKKFNTLDEPSLIAPKKTTASLEGHVLKLKAQSQSFNIYKIKR
ncbi:alpha-N-arabinofuranosidase [Parabacteroides sp. PFB2-10]|uniref:alpha-L-arabinofuranosidase C-terminal domain-containing protein n=1 Tax=Parabacteroides sp. PFB2-10 TaxID=1742405 RepID=UPI0024748C0D|nr:alpha-L-arabinofuranosidase C-terminal domain-containing protein [Parabacteroides sp. PFB2-10]MDH6311511.1 alpha-N-arabinofuranosidase [Parabacteroides sp. PFB2-10]MDL2244441.1 carbohydrate binding domain-containing protein [Parabacteroides sp. OttesenSCG-928-J18]